MHNEKPHRVRIVIAEDHALFRHGLRSLIESRNPDYEIVGEVEDGQQAIDTVLELKPDLVFMDLSMPSVPGPEAIRAIKQQLAGVKIIVITAHRSEDHVHSSLDAGADGYVLKDDTHQDVTQAVRAVLRGNKFLSPGVGNVIVSQLRTNAAEDSTARPWDTLTSRERQVLKLVAEGRTNREVAERLSISARTVEKHRASVMTKLNLRSASDLTAYAIAKNLLESL